MRGFKLCEWISASLMTEDEKKRHPDFETTGGYLREYTYKQAWANFWAETSEENRKKFLNLPNFDADTFRAITGIDVTKN